MANDDLKGETINKLRFAVDAGFGMLAGMQLDLFTPLKSGPMTAEELAAALGVSPHRLRLLLYLLVAAELLTEKAGRFAKTDEGNKYLVKGEPLYMGNQHAAIAMRWRQNFGTAESIRSGAPTGKLDFSNASPEALETFLRNINATAAPSARALVKSVDFSSIKTLLDVGCGGGGMSITITKLCPYITATAVDLASVIPIAEKIVSEEGAAERVKVVAADAVNGLLPESYDAAVLKAFLQVLSAQDARRAIRKVYDVLNPGGRLFIIGHILDDSRLTPLDAVAFNLAFINFFDSGESYTDGEHRNWLTAAGFVDIERSRLSDAGSLMTARKP
jgi:SAM-dependent methyltransferase